MKKIARPTRREFLSTAGQGIGLGLCGMITTRKLATRSDDMGRVFADARGSLLRLINEERSVEGLPSLGTDELAQQVATAHAGEMAKAGFASHWGRDGLKPYQRYSFAGGSHAVAENISAADKTWSLKPQDIAQDISYLHVRLYKEQPPNDGHRKTILTPQFTHVGFGIAIDDLRLRVVELFVAKYVEVSPLAPKAKRRATVEFTGRLLNPEHLLQQIQIYYEPAPDPPTLRWLNEPRAYSLPDEFVSLRPQLPANHKYTDGIEGVIKVSGSGSFSVPVELFNDAPTMYTIVCWVKLKRGAEAFPATNVCIRTD